MSPATDPTPSKDNILVGKLMDLLEVVAVHLETCKTQVDIREEIVAMVSAVIRELVELDMGRAIQRVDMNTGE